MLNFIEDSYNGITIDRESIISSKFIEDLKELVEFAKDDGKNLIWLTLNSKDGTKIANALNLGFKFHNCSEDELVLVLKLRDVYVPFMPTHTAGVGAVVIANNKLLMVQEKIKSHRSIYKIPGGMVDLGSSLEDSVIREVYEETGIKTELEKMVALVNDHPYRFNKANTYYVFKLKALNFDINIIDTDEIALALWYDLNEFFANEKIGDFQKRIVQSALSDSGFKKLDGSSYFNGKDFVELYL